METLKSKRTWGAIVIGVATALELLGFTDVAGVLRYAAEALLLAGVGHAVVQRRR